MHAGKVTEMALAGTQYAPNFMENSDNIDAAVEDYSMLREQYVREHKIGDGLLANHKVAAIYAFGLTKKKADLFFQFGIDATSAYRRSVLASFMFNLVFGVLFIDEKRMNKLLREDLEYCLLKENPRNLEWLCLTMHAICRACGEASNTAV